MSIFKDQHTSGESRWRRFLSFFTGRKCNSYIKLEVTYRFNQVQFCQLKDGHKGKHKSISGIYWGYGDNWLDGKPYTGELKQAIEQKRCNHGVWLGDHCYTCELEKEFDNA